MAKVLAAGGRLDSVQIVGTVTENTNALLFDGAYADCTLNCANVSAAIIQGFTDTAGSPVDVVTGETVYCHFDLSLQGLAANYIVWYLENAAGQPWLMLRGTGAALLGLFYNSGTGASPVWTQIGASFIVLTGNNYQSYDVKIELGTPHSAEVFVGGVSQASGTFTQALLTAVRQHRMLGAALVMRFSQFMATEGFSTIGGKVRYSRATGAGANSAWTGVVGSINEAIDNTTTLNTSGTAGQKQSYAMGDVSVPVGFAIKSVFHGIFAKNDGVAPLNVKSLLRSGGSDYSSANLAGIGLGFAPLIQRYDVDPATGVQFTQSGFNALEAGFESAT